MISTLILGSAVLAYLAAAAILATSLFRRSPPPRIAWLVPALLGLALHALALAGMLDAPGQARLGFGMALATVGWIMTLIFLPVSLLKPVLSLGIVVLPLAALTLLAASVLPAPPAASSAAGWQIHLHMLIALLAYSTLSLAALQALMLALQEHALRRRRLLLLLRAFPPLTLMEGLLFQLIAAGFVGLSLTLLSGVLFVENLLAQHLAHKTVLSTLAWAVFGTLLWGRWRHGWRGRRAVRLTLAGMMTLLLAYFGSKFVLEIILQRGF